MSDTLPKRPRRVCLLKSTPCPPWCTSDHRATNLVFSSGGLSVGHSRIVDGTGTWTLFVLQQDVMTANGRRDAYSAYWRPEIHLCVTGQLESLVTAANAEEYRELLRWSPLLLPGLADALREAGALLGWEGAPT